MNNMTSLQPSIVFDCFEEVTKVPRPSKKEEKMIAFLTKFGNDLGLKTVVDETGNVLISKPATKGYEHCKTVILQSHMDMVCEPSDGSFDFDNNPIETVVEGEWLKAKGTTLGADDGIGVAMQMAILKSDDIEHGPIECVFTRDEETGLTGAMGMKPDFMSGELLINLDSEDEGELYIGCAGGIDITATLEYKEEEPAADFVARQIILKGLRGGHSGLEINQGRGNANKLLARIVHDLLIEFDCRLSSFEGGNMRNAIPREAHAVLVFNPEDVEGLEDYIKEYEALLNTEYAPIEEGITLKLENVDLPAFIVPEEIQDNMISVLMACQNGVMRMIPTVPDTVETSSNLAIVTIGGGKADVRILARSSCDTMKDFLADSLTACFSMAGMKVELSGAYSGWQPNVDSPILHAMTLSYKQQLGVEPAVKVIHAGLECGIIGANCPGLDMISFGPTLRSPHSPDERAYIPSVTKFYDFLVATLEQTPEK